MTTAATVNREEDFRFGTVGKALPGVELLIAEDGEILIRSNTVFAGYFHDPEATAEVLDAEGFVHTGDVGHLDDDGFLVITDRKKDIIVTAGGKNVSPQNLENELKAQPAISQALVVGDRRPYIAALITIDPEVQVDVEEAARRAVDAVNDGRSRLRADQAVPGAAARLHDRARRADADAETPPQDRPRALRGRRRRAVRRLSV